jgi:hypothetical protein
MATILKMAGAVATAKAAAGAADEAAAVGIKAISDARKHKLILQLQKSNVSFDATMPVVKEDEVVFVTQHPQWFSVTKENGLQIEGYFQDGQPHGQATAIWPTGSSYSGGWRFGQKHGLGLQKLCSGDVFEGHFEEGKRNGEGKLVLADKRQYVGSFKHGRMSGKGTLRFPDGARYEGSFEGGTFHGQGTLVLCDQVLVGTFVPTKLIHCTSQFYLDVRLPDNRCYVGQAALLYTDIQHSSSLQPSNYETTEKKRAMLSSSTLNVDQKSRSLRLILCDDDFREFSSLTVKEAISLDKQRLEHIHEQLAAVRILTKSSDILWARELQADARRIKEQRAHLQDCIRRTNGSSVGLKQTRRRAVAARAALIESSASALRKIDSKSSSVNTWADVSWLYPPKSVVNRREDLGKIVAVISAHLHIATQTGKQMQFPSPELIADVAIADAACNQLLQSAKNADDQLSLLQKHMASMRLEHEQLTKLDRKHPADTLQQVDGNRQALQARFFRSIECRKDQGSRIFDESRHT